MKRRTPEQVEHYIDGFIRGGRVMRMKVDTHLGDPENPAVQAAWDEFVSVVQLVHGRTVEK